MDILLFKKDLEKYSKQDIMSIAKMYGFHGDLNDLRWLIAIRHYSNRGEMITGDPYVDRQILENMDDASLVNICSTNKTLAALCEPLVKEAKKRLKVNGSTILKKMVRRHGDAYRINKDIDVLDPKNVNNVLTMLFELVYYPNYNDYYYYSYPSYEDEIVEIMYIIGQDPNVSQRNFDKLVEKSIKRGKLDTFIDNPRVDFNRLKLSDTININNLRTILNHFDITNETFNNMLKMFIDIGRGEHVMYLLNNIPKGFDIDGNELMEIIVRYLELNLHFGGQDMKNIKNQINAIIRNLDVDRNLFINRIRALNDNELTEFFQD